MTWQPYVRPSSPIHYEYPISMMAGTSFDALTDEAWDAVLAALDGVKGQMQCGDDGWGIDFETSEDKMMFMLSLQWHK